ncbi:glycosyltransferase family 2 protein [Seonamhaeicola aphaedonensis]|uniref:Glycosyl transferase family 2 n=1 Tax=Seonamhaeicola aphaedonensis TaxID=1461338 RepID=A0A3D9HFX0_9FLAO|nr:glycosyltransferase family 2 protein [Seonamhaeicola aphaedonensis]RED48377.1 glycosyl transferase family 2 [Seonamhaeicola aphaedonensis]
MEDVLVSIIVPTYNHEKYISSCLDSILKQKTNFNYEVIVGEDQSRDNTREICEIYAQKHSNIIRLFLWNREGEAYKEDQSTGRNNFTQCYKKARGKYIAICEGDDYWIDEHKLQRQVDFLQANEDYSFCYTRFNTFNQENNSFKIDFNGKYFKSNQVFIDFTLETFQKGWHIGTQTLVLRKQSFNIENSKKFKYFRDIYIIVELLKKGKGACLNFVGAVYRIHGGGVHSSVSVFNGFKKGYQCHKELYLNNKKNVFLKKKIMHSAQNFIEANIQNKNIFKALILSIELFFLNWSLVGLIKNFKRIGFTFFNFRK